MQVTQADPINSKRVGVEEEFIKFRPSPNFKNMKKFLKSRGDYTESSSVAHNVGPAPQPPKKPEPRDEVKPVVVQPPLPPYPPPPDSPPNLNIVIKQEKEDVDIQNNPGDENTDNINQEQPPPAETEATEKKIRKPMCKEFIRGNCKRPVCKFAHEVDVSQLRGVFTFCWQYQNEECTFPNCRFVHADVFEEAEFYRTGILPPHARAHHKKVPPPPPPPEESQPDVQSNFVNNPPPPLHPSVEKPPPIISCIPASNMEARNMNEDFRATVPRSISPLKREWSDIDNFSSSPRDLDPNEHLTKKCKNCEIMEFRLQLNKEKVETMLQSAEDYNKKLGLLNKKSSKLTTVLLTLMKPAYTSKSGVSNGILGSEKEKTILEQLNSFVSPNNRLSSVINEDNVKVFNNILGSNINLSSLMAKLLCSTGDQNLTQDSSRET